MRWLNRRNFLEFLLYTGAGGASLPRLSRTVLAQSQQGQARFADEPVCPKSQPPARSLWALRIQELDTLSCVEPFQD